MHTPAGTNISVAAHRDGQVVVIEVHDDGPGIDPDAAARVTERFYRVDRARSREHGTDRALGLRRDRSAHPRVSPQAGWRGSSPGTRRSHSTWVKSRLTISQARSIHCSGSSGIWSTRPEDATQTESLASSYHDGEEAAHAARAVAHKGGKTVAIDIPDPDCAIKGRDDEHLAATGKGDGGDVARLREATSFLAGEIDDECTGCAPTASRPVVSSIVIAAARGYAGVEGGLLAPFGVNRSQEAFLVEHEQAAICGWVNGLDRWVGHREEHLRRSRSEVDQVRIAVLSEFGCNESQTITNKVFTPSAAWSPSRSSVAATFRPPSG